MELLIGRVGMNLGMVLMAMPLVLVTLLTPCTTMASIITVEPDDFAEGTDLTNVSPYVTLQGLDGTYGSWTVYATRSNPRYRAPTGKLVFGSFPGGLSGDGCEREFECAIGFGMTFHQPVTWVSLLSINWGYGFEGDYGLPASWFAYDASGDLIEWGTDGGGMSDNLGQVFSLNLAIPNIKSLVVGGFDTIAALEFDRLSFAVRVPEPTPLALLTISLGAIFFSRNRKVLKVVK